MKKLSNSFMKLMDVKISNENQAWKQQKRVDAYIHIKLYNSPSICYFISVYITLYAENMPLIFSYSMLDILKMREINDKKC